MLFHREVALFRLQVDGGSHLEVRARRVPFREENMERIDLAFNKPHRIEVHRAFHRVVAPAYIHRETVVDKHPHVIVTAELEVLPRNVLELRRNLHREAVVVPAAAHVPVEFRVLYRLRGIQVLEIVNRVESRVQRVVAVVLVRKVRKPEPFLVKRQVDIAAGRIRVFLAHGIGRHHLRHEPLLNLVRRRTLTPRIN